MTRLARSLSEIRRSTNATELCARCSYVIARYIALRVRPRFDVIQQRSRRFRVTGPALDMKAVKAKQFVLQDSVVFIR